MEEEKSPEISREEKFSRAKQKVKAWEGEYVASHGCRPNKEALAAAPHDIRTAYKVYCHYRKMLDSSRSGTAPYEVKSESKSADVSGGVSVDPGEAQSKYGGNENQTVYVKDADKTSGADSLSIVSAVSKDVSGDSLPIVSTVSKDVTGDSLSMVSPHVAKDVSIASNFSGATPKTSVWGQHLNKSASLIVTPKTSGNDSLYSKMAEKLRASGTVKVRTSLKKLTPGNKFKRINSLNSSLRKESDVCDVSPPSNLELIGKENEIEAGCSKKVSDDSISTPFRDCDSSGMDSSRDYVFTPESSVFSMLDKGSSRISSLLSDSLDFSGKPSPVSCDSPDFNREPKLVNDSGILRSLDDNSPKLPFRVQMNQKITNSISQPVNIASVGSIGEQQPDSKVKRKTALNRGWLARCVGPALGVELDAREGDENSDDWKMKLVDVEWNDEMEKEGSSDDGNNRQTTPESELVRSQVSSGRKRGRGRGKKLYNNVNKDQGAGYLEKEDGVDGQKAATPKQRGGRRGNGRRRKEVANSKTISHNVIEEEEEEQGPEGYIEREDDVDGHKPAASKQRGGRRGAGRGRKQVTTTKTSRRKGSLTSSDCNFEHVECGNNEVDEDCEEEIQKCPSIDLNDSPFEFHESFDHEQEQCIVQNKPRRGRSALRKLNVVRYDLENDIEEEMPIKRKREEDLEELEQSGKIQSSWPPPKKVRKARKATDKTRMSRRKVEKIKNAPIPIDLPEAEGTKSNKNQTRKQRCIRKRTVNSAMSNSPKVKVGISVMSRNENLEKSHPSGIRNSGTLNVAPVSRVPRVSRPKRKAKQQVSSLLNDTEQEEPTEVGVSDNSQVVKPNQDRCEEIKEYDELDDIESNTKKNQITRKYLSKEDHFKRKVSSGSANRNYVKINLKKKTYVRGKKYMNVGKYKRQEWKRKQLMKSAEGGNETAIKSLTCFKCGDFGHWSKYCPGKKGDGLMPLEEYDEKESTFLSLEEAAALARGIKPAPAPIAKIYPMGEGEHSKKESIQENIDIDIREQEAGTPSTESRLNGEDEKINLPKVNEDPEAGEESELVHASQKEVGEKSELLQSSQKEVGEESELVQSSQKESVDDVDELQEHDSDDDLFATVDEINQAPDDESLEQYSSQGPSVPSYTNAPLCDRQTVDPVYATEDGEVGPTPNEVYETLRLFGYASFRSGQENAIMRILSGLSTLLVLSTGSGKSLCYQLPAYIYAKRSNCITLCISPLVSLMEDQVSGLPKFLRAVCLHTHQNNSQRAVAINAIQSGNAHILLVSPEAIVGCQSGGMLGSLLKDLPPVAFACLDEAHCVSEWSHNFRPSYLRVCQVLRERLGVKTILGLTATARLSTAHSIAEQLEIQDFDAGIIRGTSVPKNLMLSVSRDEVREQALIALLQGDRFTNCNSIIIYCTRRDECERIATLIRTQLMEPSKVDVKSNAKRVRAISYDAEAYHAGLSSYRRQQVQKQFMSGKVRIVVATVAFGMGIDKSDVRGIIHFNMPRNIESYVQEIGRAGRDGEEAHCHLFLDAHDGRDIQELKRHIYANSLDRHTVRKLLIQVFKTCVCVKVKNSLGENEETPKDESSHSQPGTSVVSPETSNQSPKDGNSDEGMFPVFPSSSCPRHEVAISISDLIDKLDLPEENLATLLCYLELHWGNLVKLGSHVYANCTVSCYGGPRQLVSVSRRCPPLGVAIALERQKGKIFDRSSKVSFPVVDIASRMGWNSKIVKRELKALEWDTFSVSNGGKAKRSGVTVEFDDLSFHLEARGDLTDNELDVLLDALFCRIQLREKEQLRQLHYTYQLLYSVSHKSILMCCDNIDEDRCSRLREGLSKYFSKEGKVLSDVRIEEQVYLRPEIEQHIRSSVRSVLSTHSDHQWTGRSMARVFHGIGSPRFPAEVWGRVRRIWRLHLNVEFNLLVNIATHEILRCK